ncbi:hypothetical protein [Bacteroides sp.]|uniref:hypothetical protein n=1 Tax=Bacteroides sp. TaxID=29523 RepID=UPI00260241E0|nr:hypothetical protein [Bacteroides sp.]MDD3038882.1 hypothetical protein [Bacteroides sp.]
MKKVLSLIMLIITNGLFLYSQNSYKITDLIKASDIKEKSLQRVFNFFSMNQFLKLPINYDISFFVYQDTNSISRDEFEQTRAVTQGSSYKINNSPFYANLDKRDKKPPVVSVLSLIKDTNGKYILGIVKTFSACHDMSKSWLVTFSFPGTIIDYIPIYEYQGETAVTMEAQINKDFTVNVQRLDFSDYNYIFQFDSIKKDFIYPDNLRGQRVDTKYQIMPDGKFKKQEEIRYQPQIYTPEMFSQEEVTIRQRKEKRM